MFTRGVERRRQLSPGVVDTAYRCAKCGTALELERVVSVEVERGDDGVTGYVVFVHHCPCTPVGLLATRAWATHAAFVALFGQQPWLPYRAPFRYGAVTDDHPVVARWRWELEQVADSREFLLFLDDATGETGGRSAA